MNIIIPLGGKGERFKKQGYDNPKPLIKVFNKEILFYVIDNLEVNNEDIIFIIYNKDLDNYNFSNIIKNNYSNINLIKLNKDTNGASETIFIGLNEIIKNYKYNKKSILIDGDTFYTSNIINKFRLIDNKNAVFFTKNYDINPLFSYIKMDNENNITNIAEKNKISDNANTGAYAFNDINILYNYAKYVVENDIRFNNECYTSCIISEMINKNEPFLGIELNINSVHVLGTPEQVKDYIYKNFLDTISYDI
jgi:dTDP-glucose pyrophosphorylase